MAAESFAAARSLFVCLPFFVRIAKHTFLSQRYQETKDGPDMPFQCSLM